jgi:hypothetical protein
MVAARLRGQRDFKCRSFAGFAEYLQPSLVLVDDFGNDRQAQADALGFGCEERIEDAFEMLRLNPFAVIAHEDD